MRRTVSTSGSSGTLYSGHTRIVIVRPCKEPDLPEILEILNREIVVGYSHFGLEPEPLERIEAEWRDAQGRYPWYVAEDHGITGFARASSWKRRGAYNATCEVGIYIRPESQGHGIGKLIYTDFIPALAKAEIHTALGGIALPNPASIKLHEAFGFRHVGTLPEVGFKHGRWIDVGYWALTM